MSELYLSNQARWYLGGEWPIYDIAITGHARPEPTAIQELVDKGLAIKMHDYYLTTYWSLTEAGKKIKYGD